MKKTLFALIFSLSIMARAEFPSALLMVCTNLNQPDLKELSVLRDDLNSDSLTMYLTDQFNRLSFYSYTLEDYREGLFVLPDFVGNERQLQREQDGWHVYIYYKNKVISKPAECSETPTTRD